MSTQLQTEQHAIVEQEMNTIIFYLTAFAYVDGHFDTRERAYIETFITKLVGYRARLALKDADAALREEQTQRWTQHFHEVFGEIDQDVKSYFTESVADGEEQAAFVAAKLKLRCYELFQGFNRENQTKLLLLADEIAHADGQLHPSEAAFRAELEALLAADEGEGPRAEGAGVAGDGASMSTTTPTSTSTTTRGDLGAVTIEAPRTLVPRQDNYEFFQAFEQPYERDPARFAEQCRADLTLIDKTIAKWNEHRAQGVGALLGVHQVGELASRAPFLDGHVYVVPEQAARRCELLVLGDLHGCYSCLKAALMQADFFAKVDAHHVDPEKNPAMKLVLLGDYIDRGRYSYNGILRTVMQLFLTVPEHVYILRGNHEYYVEFNGRIYGGVRPAEAIESLAGIAPIDLFQAYKRLFEAMPCSLLFDRTLFAHGGIPREDTLSEKWRDLSSLNDAEIRFQMLWSDPSDADAIPLELQKANARFPFGRQQFKSFVKRLGCTTMVRGHERVVEGLRRVYDDPEATLLTLFSAGGAFNDDLPPTSNYREVTPMALSIRYDNGRSQVTPFVLDYARYNGPEYNLFRRGEAVGAGEGPEVEIGAPGAGGEG